MSYSVETLKGEISRGGGVAKGNLYRVLMPLIPRIYINLTGVDVPYPQSMNVLCKNISMPGRQLTTIDREIGVVQQKVAYGYTNEDVSMTFIGLNDFVVRKYLEDWQNFALNERNELRYKNEYARTITIQQLNQDHSVMYAIQLEGAFPYQLLNVDYANENGQPVDITAVFTYTKWRRTGFVRDVISTEAQKFLEKLLLKD